MRKVVLVVLLAIMSLASSVLLVNGKTSPGSAPDYSTAYELIEAVNALRAEYGLYPYVVNSILMDIAQTQAEYLAAIGVSTTHIDAYGRRPYQRALDAGYAVAGDLSLGGFFSENVIGNINLTAQGAVDWWMGDDPHKNTMLSETLEDVGAGVAVVGNTYYYVLDAGLATGGTPRAYTPPPYILVNTPTIVTNTPRPDGVIIHVVQPGDTLLEIAIAYDVSLSELYALNGLSENSVIFPDQQIIVRAGFTATPTFPTLTPTLHPSSTAWPTSRSTTQVVEPSPTQTSSPALPATSAGGAVIGIIVAALIAAAVLTLAGTRKKK